MFTHIMVGANDVEAARTFYDATLSALGHDKAGSPEGAERLYYGAFGQGPVLGVGKPGNGEPATYANGGTLGLSAQTKEQVDAWHAAGLVNGGSDEGAPGRRPNAPGNSYGAYLRDPDGNKLCAFCQLPV